MRLYEVFQFWCCLTTDQNGKEKLTEIMARVGETVTCPNCKKVYEMLGKVKV